MNINNLNSLNDLNALNDMNQRNLLNYDNISKMNMNINKQGNITSINEMISSGDKCVSIINMNNLSKPPNMFFTCDQFDDFYRFKCVYGIKDDLRAKFQNSLHSELEARVFKESIV